MAATQADRVKLIADNIEATHKNLQVVARNLTGLLQVGRATCEEIKAYNLWARALYDTHRGMLTALRNVGEKVPAEPPTPTWFAWQGVPGSEPWRILCKPEQTLTGPLQDAMVSTQRPEPAYVSTSDFQVVTQAPAPSDDAAAPSLAQLATAAQLGALPVLWIVVATVIIVGVGIAVGVPAMAHYFEEKAIQEETTRRTQIQSEAFKQYTSARFTCYQDCTSRGSSPETCTQACAKLVDKPNLVIDAARRQEGGGWGFFGTVGIITAAILGFLAWQRYKHRVSGWSDDQAAASP